MQESLDLRLLIDQLRQDPEALRWAKRRDMVRALADQIAVNGPTEDALLLLRMMAGDSKWEVRKEVADCLPLVPDNEFPGLAVLVADDSNAFVRQATERALDRRRRGAESSRRRRRSLDHVEDDYASIERAYGAVAAEKARRMAERLYDVLVGATVHDMRNLLTPLKSTIASLLDSETGESTDPTRLRKHLAKMQRQAIALERMLDDMRTYSQTTPDERRPESVKSMVNEAHGQVLDFLMAEGRDANRVVVQMNVDTTLTVDVARHQIVRAIANVIKNAYEAFSMGPADFREGEIKVIARAVDQDRAELVVSDSGMGLSKDELNEIQRFVPGGTSKKTHGTGFGLPIAKRKIEDHGGSLAIDSEEDAGTTVTITLPIEAEGGST